VPSKPGSGHVTDRQWSSYGEPAYDDVIDDDDDATDEAERLGDNGNASADDAAVTASCVTSKSSSVTSSGDVRRHRTTADGCEDDSVVGPGALDLIRHVILPAAATPSCTDSVLYSTTWKASDDNVENSVDELDSSHVKTNSLVVDSH